MTNDVLLPGQANRTVICRLTDAGRTTHNMAKKGLPQFPGDPGKMYEPVPQNRVTQLYLDSHSHLSSFRSAKLGQEGQRPKWPPRILSIIRRRRPNDTDPEEGLCFVFNDSSKELLQVGSDVAPLPLHTRPLRKLGQECNYKHTYRPSAGGQPKTYYVTRTHRWPMGLLIYFDTYKTCTWRGKLQELGATFLW